MKTKTKQAAKATTKKASAKPAPKVKAKIRRELDGYTALKCAQHMLGTLPCSLLKDLCKLHDVPVAKYKEDQVIRLASYLVFDLNANVTISIG